MAKNTPQGRPNRQSRGLRTGTTGVADWTSADSQLLQRAIATAASTGGALRFGYTSDGGAYAVGIYGDGSPYTEYVSPHQDIDITLRAIIDLFESIRDDVGIAGNGSKSS